MKKIKKQKDNFIKKNVPMLGILTIVLLLFLNITGCKIFSPLSPSSWNLETVYVEGLTIPDSSKVNVSFQIRIQGSFPDPSWEFDHFELFMEESLLTIKPIGKKNLQAESVAQVLIPFEEETSFTPRRIGLLKVSVVGKIKTFQKNVTIIR